MMVDVTKAVADLKADIRKVGKTPLTQGGGVKKMISEPCTEFVSTIPFHDEWGDTLVFYCADPRFRPQTLEFLNEILELEYPVIISIPAGVAPLLPLVGFAHKAVKAWVDLLMRNHRLRSIVCVAHEDCSGYKHAKNPVVSFLLQKMTGGDAKALQQSHLQNAKATLLTWFPGIEVAAYYAELEGNVESERYVVFRKIA